MRTLISNSYLDLRPVVKPITQHFGNGYLFDPAQRDGRIVVDNTLVLLSPDRRLLDSLSRRAAEGSDGTDIPVVRMWTDDYSNIVQVLKR